MSDEKQALEMWCQYTEKARRDLLNQTLRERTTVAGLLNVLRIQYEDCEIRKEKKEQSPIDVHFRGSRFQVTEILDKDRRRDAELRAQVKNLTKAETIIEMCQPVSSLNPTALTPDEYFQLILSRSQDKLEKYKRVEEYANLLASIDLLVYLNQQSTHLYPTEPWPDLAPFMQHGWRSAAFVGGGPYARVLYAKDDAPDFLREAVGKTHFWEQGPTSIFPQRLGPQCGPEAKSAQGY